MKRLRDNVWVCWIVKKKVLWGHWTEGATLTMMKAHNPHDQLSQWRGYHCVWVLRQRILPAFTGREYQNHSWFYSGSIVRKAPDFRAVALSYSHACRVGDWIQLAVTHQRSTRSTYKLYLAYRALGRLRSSNCNSDTIEGLPDWVVVEMQEYDLPKEAIRQLYHCYKTWNNNTIESNSIDAQNDWLNCFFYFIIIKSDSILIILTSIESVERVL